MKKFIFIPILIILATFTLSGCKQKIDLTDKISELRYDILTGQTENYTLKAEVGERETPCVTDGEIKEKTPYVTLTLTASDLNITYTASFIVEGVTYSQKFAVSPANSKLQATFNARITTNELSVKINGGSNLETIVLKSVMPTNAKDYKTALNSLLISQPDLINKYITDGVFHGEIAVRLLVEKGKGYYYIGLTDLTKNTTALLIDAENLEVLAIRKIFG